MEMVDMNIRIMWFSGSKMTFLEVFDMYLTIFDINSQYLVRFNQYLVKIHQY